MDEASYIVAGMSCEHCRESVTEELARVPGVEHVDVDLETKLVRVRGRSLEDTALVAAIDEAGYDAVPA
jgi:copper chaperone